jgi:urease accessory protein
MIKSMIKSTIMRTVTITSTITDTNMGESSLALFAWLSPAYPVGAFAYSHGLEWAVEADDVSDGVSLRDWVEQVLEHGSGRNDALLFAAAWRAVQAQDMARLREISQLACALAPSRERRLESVQQGAAFRDATSAAWPHPLFAQACEAMGAQAPYVVCFAAAAGAHGLPLRPALDGFLAAFAANLISAAVRLSVVGQTEGQSVLARLAPLAARVAQESEAGDLDELGGCAFRVDLASLRHETQYSRLFRS